MIFFELHWQYMMPFRLIAYLAFSHKKKKSNLRAHTVYVGIYKLMVKIWGVKKWYLISTPVIWIGIFHHLSSVKHFHRKHIYILYIKKLILQRSIDFCFLVKKTNNSNMHWHYLLEDFSSGVKKLISNSLEHIWWSSKAKQCTSCVKQRRRIEFDCVFHR